MVDLIALGILPIIAIAMMARVPLKEDGQHGVSGELVMKLVVMVGVVDRALAQTLPKKMVDLIALEILQRTVNAMMARVPLMEDGQHRVSGALAIQYVEWVGRLDHAFVAIQHPHILGLSVEKKPLRV